MRTRGLNLFCFWVVILALCAGADFASPLISATTLAIQQLDDNIIYVTSVHDSASSNASNCLPLSSLSCNLRSAWLACPEFIATYGECIITLPVNSSGDDAPITLFMNASLGALQFTDGRTNVTIHGNGATITILDDVTPIADIFAPVTLDVSRSNDNPGEVCEISIEGCIGDEISVTTCPSNTTVEANASEADTYLRLYGWSATLEEDGVLIRENDNDGSCTRNGLASTITYAVPLTLNDDTPTCSHYCFDLVCSSNSNNNSNDSNVDPCAAVVVESYRQNLTGLSRLIEYEYEENIDTASDMSAVAELRLYNLSVVGFDNRNTEGGAIYWRGPGVLTIEDASFFDNQGLSGGAIYVSDNNDDNDISNTNSSNSSNSSNRDQRSVAIRNCYFEGNFAGGDGGGIAVSSSVNVVIANTIFASNYVNGDGGSVHIGDECEDIELEYTYIINSVSGGGGACMYVGTDNTRISVKHSTFTGCSAMASSGGAMKFNKRNTDVFIYNSTFTLSYAWEGGGGVVVDSKHEYFTISHCIFSNITTGLDSVGGAIYVEGGNAYTLIEHTIVTHCVSDTGGGIAIEEENVATTLRGVTVAHCTALAVGGGVYVGSGNPYLDIENSTITHCTSLGAGGALVLDRRNNDWHVARCTLSHSTALLGGGGLAAFESNENGTLINSTISDCYATDGGGIYLDREMNAMDVIRVDVRRCGATLDGGGMYILNDMSHLSFHDVQLTSCSAVSGSGGGIYVGERVSSVALSNSTLKNCSAGVSGGGLFAKFTAGVVLEHTGIEDCEAHTGSGGAVQLDASNNRFVLYRCTLQQNQAATSGGGIHSGDTNLNVHIVGSLLERNVAGTHGGGLFVQSGNENLMIIDSRTYTSTSIVETRHPYQVEVASTGGGVADDDDNAPVVIAVDDSTDDGNDDVDESYLDVLNEQIYVAGASEFLISFDSNTKINVLADSFVIWDHNDTRNILFAVYEGFENWPGISLPVLRIPGPSFHIRLYKSSDDLVAPTTRVGNFYGVRMNVMPVFSQPEYPTQFVSNTAEANGGGIAMVTSVSFPALIYPLFRKNTAYSTGGGLYLRSSMSGVLVYGGSFEENHSGDDGGAVGMSSSNIGMHFVKSGFVNNTADVNGGVLSINADNGIDGLFAYNDEIIVADCYLINNTAGAAGGALFVDISNEVIVDNSDFTGNRAITSGGGAIHIGTRNIMSIENTTFVSNDASHWGGAIDSVLGNALSLHNVNMSRNHASSYGGAMCIRGGSDVAFIGQSHINGNTAGDVGGAIASFSSLLWSLPDSSSSSSSSSTSTDVTSSADALAADSVGGAGLAAAPPFVHIYFCQNTAKRGSALYFMRVLSSSSSRALRNLAFIGNTALVGGTVYWLQDSSMTQPPAGLSNSTAGSDGGNILWWENTAPYGNVTATQALHLQGPSSYTAEVYGSALVPAISFALYDYYYQRLPLQEPMSVDAALWEDASDNLAYQCSGLFPFLSNGQAVFANTSAVFGSLEVSCAPEGYVSVEFEAVLADLVEVRDVGGGEFADLHVSTTTNISFRSCVAGEVIDQGMCVECPTGTYSLEYPVTTSTTCVSCESKTGISSCYGDQIIVDTGYWRRTNTHVAVLPCILDNACVSTNVTGVETCDVGYTGLLCSTCAGGYYLDGSNCVSCTGSDGLSPTTIFYLVILGILFVIFCIYVYYRYISPKLDEMDEETERATGQQSMRRRLMRWWEARNRDVIIKLKIVVTTYQVVSEIPNTMAVQFPLSVDRFFQALSAVNFNFVNGLPIDCSGDYNFVDKLLLVTLCPIGASLFLACCAMVEYTVRKGNMTFQSHGMSLSRFMLQATRHEVVDKYLNLFFYLTYLVLPSVTTTIFQTYLCTNVDPDGEDVDNDLYLTADMRISCSSHYYIRTVIYASLMVLVYPIGIPLLYFVVLYTNKEEISTRDDSLNKAAHGTTVKATIRASMSGGLGGGDTPRTPAAAAARTPRSVPRSSTGEELPLPLPPPSALSSSRARLPVPPTPDYSADHDQYNNSTITATSNTNNHTHDDDMVRRMPESPVGAGLTLVIPSSPLADREKENALGSALPSSRDSSKGYMDIHGRWQLSNRAERISFLWEDYEPQFWYWEVVEATRRLMLTAVLSVAGNGTSMQSIFALLLGLLYIKIYGYFEPYIEDADDIMAETGQFQIFFSFLGALIYQNSLLGAKWDAAVSSILIAVNLVICVLFAYLLFDLIVLAPRRKVREKEQALQTQQQQQQQQQQQLEDGCDDYEGNEGKDDDSDGDVEAQVLVPIAAPAALGGEKAEHPTTTTTTAAATTTGRQDGGGFAGFGTLLGGSNIGNRRAQSRKKAGSCFPTPDESGRDVMLEDD